MRCTCNQNRWAVTRERARGVGLDQITTLELAYKKARRKHWTEIKKAKAPCWTGLCNELENDPWGAGYKIVTNKFKHLLTPYELDVDRKMMIERELFPQCIQPMLTKVICSEPTPFSQEELTIAIKRLKSDKAPGPDRILPDCIKLAVQELPELFLSIFNNILKNTGTSRQMEGR